jgi:hypothetical protein
MGYRTRNEGLPVQDQLNYRCIHPPCARPMPRPVNWCPWCGTAQHAPADAASIHRPAPDGATVTPAEAPAAPVRQGPAAPQPVKDSPAGAPPLSAPPASEWGASAGAARSADARPAPQVAAAAASAARPTSPTAADSRPGKAGAAPRPAAPARVRQREPVRLRWWLLALAALWVVWFMAKPSTRRINTRIDHAIALAAECKSREAQSELIALRATRATQDQLQHVQRALNDAAAECRRARQRQRGKALGEAGAADRSLAGAIDGVARPAARQARPAATREHPLVTDTP